jgi:hypothetical protein
MVLIDRQGHRETRRLRRYSRVEKNKHARFLLLFDSPDDVRGVAVLAETTPDGEMTQYIYLPAFGPTMIVNGSDVVGTSFLGTDFSVENLTGEKLSNYDYERRRDAVLKNLTHFVVDVFSKGSGSQTKLRRHYLRQDNLYITRTDHFDELGRLKKRRSNHDLTQVLGDMWRANMLLMEDHQNQHKTLIKINRRVFSADYAPEEVFTANWLFQNSKQRIIEFESPDPEDEPVICEKKSKPAVSSPERSVAVLEADNKE